MQHHSEECFFLYTGLWWPSIDQTWVTDNLYYNRACVFEYCFWEIHIWMVSDFPLVFLFKYFLKYWHLYSDTP